MATSVAGAADSSVVGSASVMVAVSKSERGCVSAPRKSFVTPCRLGALTQPRLLERTRGAYATPLAGTHSGRLRNPARLLFPLPRPLRAPQAAPRCLAQLLWLVLCLGDAQQFLLGRFTGDGGEALDGPQARLFVEAGVRGDGLQALHVAALGQVWHGDALLMHLRHRAAQGIGHTAAVAGGDAVE